MTTEHFDLTFERMERRIDKFEENFSHRIDTFEEKFNHRIEQLEYRLTIRMGGMIAAAIAALAAIMRIH